MTYLTGCGVLAVLLAIRVLAGGNAHQDRAQRVQVIVHHTVPIVLCGGMLLILAVLEITSIALDATQTINDAPRTAEATSALNW